MISRLLNIHRIKFTRLQELFSDYKGKGVVNVHIDLHSILSDLYKASNYAETNWLEEDDSMVISSCLINIAAHYRLFFYSKFRMSTRIFLYFGNARPRNNTEYFHEYGYKFFDKYSKENEDFSPVNKEVSSNLKLCKTITEYIPGIDYIDCKNIDPMIACGHMIIKHSGDHVVLTRDEYWYQTINAAKNVKVLRSKRDESFIVDRDNIYDILLAKNSYKAKYVTAEMLSFVYTFGGVKSRDVRGLQKYGYTKIIKILDSAIDRKLIQPVYTQIKNVLDEIYDGDKSDYLMDVFRSIDLRYQLNKLTLAQKESLDNCISSKYNRRDLLKLNTTYYTGENSLMLDELFKGAQDTFKW